MVEGDCLPGGCEIPASVDRLGPPIKLLQCQITLPAVALLAVANRFLEGRQQVKGDVGGLKAFRIRVRDVMHQRAEGGRPRRDNRLCSRGQCGRLDPGHESGGNGFDVSFDAADLARQDHERMCSHLQRFREQTGRIDVGVAVNLPIAQEARIFEPGISRSTRACSPNFK